jgi:putative polyketide hydroxylase
MDKDASVLIAGGGLVGLSTALFLSDLGVPVLLAEQHRGTSTLPRGRGLNLRAMELFRAAGVEDALRAAPPSVLKDFPEVARARTLAGEETFRAVRPAPDSYAGVSPTSPIMIDQNAVEPVLREHAGRRGADLRFGTRLLSFEQDVDGVTATLLDREKDAVHRVRSDYLVAADGHRSRIRERLGIGGGGDGGIVGYVSIPFEADLTGPLRGRPLALCYLEEPAPRTVLTRLDSPTRWVLMVPDHLGGADLPPGRCRELVERAIGVPGHPVRLLHDGREPLDTWQIASWVADRYRAGRVLLAGDAAHVTPPAGGLGGNTGIQDAHNLAWKLAAVLRGGAAPGLLSTYERERRGAALLACEFSAHTERARATGEAPARPGLDDPLAVALGYQYRSAAVLAEDDGGDAAPSREFAGRPGSRAPHLWMARGGERLSTLDLYRGRFVLVAGPAGDGWADGARRLDVPAGLDVHQVGGDLDDPDGEWPAAHGVSGSGAVLVRPDGFVCWRSPGAPQGDPADVLADVLRRVLGTPEAAAVASHAFPGTGRLPHQDAQPSRKVPWQ